MGFLSRLLGRKQEVEASEAAAPEPVCPHAALIPRWENAGDMGNAELISSYTCESCRTTFSRLEGLRILEHAADSVRIEEELRV